MATPELVERSKERVGLVLRDKWRLDSLLGVGGSAAVYAATHRNGKRGAIKLLHPEFASQTDFVRRFLQEGYVANKIEHPGAVSILDDDYTDDGLAFLVMELLEGYTLERRLRKQSQVPVRDALRIVEDLLDVVAAAHEKGIVHRDIKPANIFVTKQNQVKVLDFGIARLGEAKHLSGSTQIGMPLGTPAFMPPEQARGRWGEVDARTDLWAVGALLWALLSGQRPRRADTPHAELILAMTEAMPPIASVVPQASVEVSKLVDRALAFDMSARWPNARTMQQALRLALLLEQASTSGPAPRPPSIPAAGEVAPVRLAMGPISIGMGGKLPGATISGLGSGNSILRPGDSSPPDVPTGAGTGSTLVGPPPVPSPVTAQSAPNQAVPPPSLDFTGPLSQSRFDALGERPSRRPMPLPAGSPSGAVLAVSTHDVGEAAFERPGAGNKVPGSSKKRSVVAVALVLTAIAMAAFFAYRSGWLH